MRAGEARERIRGERRAGRLSLFVAALAVTVACPVSEAAESEEAVAVFDIATQDVAGFRANRMAKFTDLLESAFASSGFRTIPRSEIQAALSEKKAESYEACYDEACQIEIGKEVAASKALSSMWARFGEVCVLTIKLFDLKTNLTELSEQAEGLCDDAGLRAAIERIGTKLRLRKGGDYGTFELDLEEGRAIKNPPTDQTGYLKIRAQAKGRPGQQLEVFLNGELAGSVAGGLFTKELPVGAYVVVLRSPGAMYRHQRFDIEMARAGVTIPRQGVVELVPDFGTLIVQGKPKKATVMINGEPRRLEGGRLEEERRIGLYTVVIEAPGHLPSEPREIEITSGKTSHIPFSLVRNAGEIEVSGKPAGAVVQVGGRRAGQIPIWIRSVDVGDHVLEISAPGHHSHREVVSVQQGGSARLRVDLKRKLARLKIESIARVGGEAVPVEADVLLNRKRVGTTPWKGEVLAEVQHSIALELGGLIGAQRGVRLAEGAEHRAVVEVPGSWAGAKASLSFDLVDGPWRVVSGDNRLKLEKRNAVRPGRVPIELMLDGKSVYAGEAEIAPDQHATVRVSRRPRTDEELDDVRSAWATRKWLATGLALGAGGLGTWAVVRADGAERDRNASVVGLLEETNALAYDELQDEIRTQESKRSTAQIVGLSALGAAAGLAVWAAIEWFWVEPQRGDLEVRIEHHP